MLPQNVASILTGLVVAVVLGLFAALFTYAILQIWQSSSAPTYTEGLLYAATGLAALVGGVMAVAFHVNPPTTARGQAGAADGVDTKSAGKVPVIHAMASSMPTILASAYVAVYLVIGLAAVITWILRPAQTSDLVKNLSTTFLGLVIPIVASFFGVTASKS